MPDEPELERGVLARMSGLQKAGALVVGLLLAGTGFGVWWANFEATYATKAAVDRHADAAQEAHDELEDDIGGVREEMRGAAKADFDARDKLWQQVSGTATRVEGNAARLEILMLMVGQRQSESPAARRAYHRRIQELREGAPPSPTADPLGDIREEL